MKACLHLVVKRDNNNLSARWGSRQRRMCVHLLQEGELLGYVLCAALILAEGESLLTVQADAGEVIHHGAVARHRQGCGNGEGLLFGQRCRRLHYSWESPLKSWERDVTREDKRFNYANALTIQLWRIHVVFLCNSSKKVECINKI